MRGAGAMRVASSPAWGRVRAPLAAFLVVTASCSATNAPPLPDLAQSLHAQEEFQPLRGKWEHTDDQGRLALEPQLLRYVRVHPQDPTWRTANGMLSLIALQKGDIDNAERLAAKVVTGRDGTTKDLGLVTYGAIERRRGHAAKALAILGPLFGKIIDAYARGVLNEEIALAAIEAGKPDDAVKYLRGWIERATDEDKDDIERRVDAIIARLPAPPLVGLVETARGTDEMKTSLLRMTGRRLASIAIDTQDVALARLLVSEAGPLLGDRADAVARVAARGAAIRLEPNTVGLLLSQRSSELRRRSLEVAEGLSIALGLPGSSARLVSRDDQGDPAKIDEALALLNADGAAVIVAGIDPREANAAFDYAERTGVPIVLLRPPDRIVDPKGHVFVMGDAPLASRTLLVQAAISAGKDRVALLVGERTESDSPPGDTNGGVVAVQPCGAPTDFARSAGASALIVDAGPVCAREASETTGLALGLGLDGPEDLAVRFRAKAGRFPVAPSSASGDADLTALLALKHEPPTWWSGLGHDAGKITWAAVSKLPAETPNDAQAMAARKEQVTQLLAEAEVPLWTTNAVGFGGTRVIPREITVETKSGPAEPHPARPGARTAPKR